MEVDCSCHHGGGAAVRGCVGFKAAAAAWWEGLWFISVVGRCVFVFGAARPQQLLPVPASLLTSPAAAAVHDSAASRRPAVLLVRPCASRRRRRRWRTNWWTWSERGLCLSESDWEWEWECIVAGWPGRVEEGRRWDVMGRCVQLRWCPVWRCVCAD